MKKLVKLLLVPFLLILFTNSYSQDSLSIIPINVGKWCLEKNEENKVLHDINLSKDSVIHNNKNKITLLNDNISEYKQNQIDFIKIINTYKSDSITFESSINVLEIENGRLKITKFGLISIIIIETILLLLKG